MNDWSTSSFGSSTGDKNHNPPSHCHCHCEEDPIISRQQQQRQQHQQQPSDPERIRLSTSKDGAGTEDYNSKEEQGEAKHEDAIDHSFKQQDHQQQQQRQSQSQSQQRRSPRQRKQSLFLVPALVVIVSTVLVCLMFLGTIVGTIGKRTSKTRTRTAKSLLLSSSSSSSSGGSSSSIRQRQRSLLQDAPSRPTTLTLTSTTTTAVPFVTTTSMSSSMDDTTTAGSRDGNAKHKPLSSEDLVPRYAGPSKLEEMTPDQKEIRDYILESRPRTGLSGPFGPWMAVPEIARPASQLGKACRYDTSLKFKESELVILLTGAYNESPTEFDIHVGEALKAGWTMDVIQTIPRSTKDFTIEHMRSNLLPLLQTDRERALMTFVTELLVTKTVSDETYEQTKATFDNQDPVLVEITSIVGYYTYVAMTLNVFQIPSK